MVQSSKTGETSFLNYDDICYSSGEDSQPYFNLHHLAEWGFVICSSANAIEVRK